MMWKNQIGAMVATVVFTGLCAAPTVLAVGPDVIVGDLPTVRNWTAPPIGAGPTGGMCRYSFATTSCNIGTVPLHWYDFGTGTPTEHPVISQNLFRLKNGQFEQLGQAWLKHGFCALQGGLCASCSPFCGGCCDELGVGCSDPYDSQRNGDPGGIGPKSQINAAAGLIMVWPYSHPQSLSTGSNNNGQMQIPVADVDPAQNVGALYFVEGQYVAHDDATAGNDNNNASYRRISFGASTGFPGTLSSTTQRQKPAIQAWQDSDPTVTIVTNDTADGRFTLGYKVTNLGGNLWHYEFAVHNMNSDRSAQSFKIPVPDCTVISAEGFRDVAYHSGDGVTIGTNYDGTDWSMVRTGGMLTWTMVPASPVTNSNALRWGTMYNFRFNANMPPQAASATMDMFKTGSPADISFAVLGPSGNNVPACPADANDNMIVDIDDLVLVITSWGSAGPTGDVSPPCGDSQVNIDDLVAVITTWGSCKK